MPAKKTNLAKTEISEDSGSRTNRKTSSKKATKKSTTAVETKTSTTKAATKTPTKKTSNKVSPVVAETKEAAPKTVERKKTPQLSLVKNETQVKLENLPSAPVPRIIPPYTPGHDEIALRAWEIWQREGCPSGRDRENWAAAEQELIREHRALFL